MGTADQAWHLNPTIDGGLFQAPSSVVSCQVDPNISQLSIWVVWICLVCIFVQSLSEVKALQMGVRLCEAARADPCLCVWQGWPTDRLLDGLDEGR